MVTRTQERDQQGFWRELLDFVSVFMYTHTCFHFNSIFVLQAIFIISRGLELLVERLYSSATSGYWMACDLFKSFIVSYFVVTI